METKIPDVSGALLRETHGPLRVELKFTSCHSFGSVKTISKKTTNKRKIRLYFGLSYGVLGLAGFAALSNFLLFFQTFWRMGGYWKFGSAGGCTNQECL